MSEPSCSCAPVGKSKGRSARRTSTGWSRATRVGELEAGITSTRHYGERGEAREEAVTVFIESFVLPPRLIIFGAVDFTAALVRVGKVLGYRVTVCDARAVFATVQRFPHGGRGRQRLARPPSRQDR